MLLALLAAKHRNELKNLDVRYMNNTENKIIISTECTTETSKLGKKPPNMSLQRFTDDEALCLYKRLEHYLETFKH